MRAKPLSSPVPVVCAPISAASQLDQEPGAAVEALAEGSEAPMRARLPPRLLAQFWRFTPLSRWLPSQIVRVRGRLGLTRCLRWTLNSSGQFSPLNLVGREGDPWSEEVEDVFTELLSISDKEECDSQMDMTASVAAYANGIGENNYSPLECVPLSCWIPRVAEDLVLSTVDEEDEFDASKVEHSKWVSTMMKSFCKMVGFPIVKHEAHCVALFHLLEQECIEVARDGCIRPPVKVGHKGLRELRGLFSSVNYDGTFSRNRGLSSRPGAIGSY